MKISIIIPAFNEEKYIRDCLDHIMSQSIKAEVIVVDNASTDATVLIAKSFRGVKVATEDSPGVTKARQRGLRAATGDIVAYVDADTRMPDGWLQYAVDAFKNDKKLVLLSGPYVYYDHPLIYRALIWLFWRLLAWPAAKVFGYLAIGGNAVARRSALKMSGGFNPDIDFYGDDADFARRLHEHGKALFDLDFFMLTSARRFHQEGFVLIAARYILNYLMVVFKKHPVTVTHKNLR